VFSTQISLIHKTILSVCRIGQNLDGCSSVQIYVKQNSFIITPSYISMFIIIGVDKLKYSF